VNSVVVNFINLQHNATISDDDLRSLWDLETIGISSKPDRSLSVRDSTLLKEFRESFCEEDRRRVVRLPKKRKVTLPSNGLNAKIRLINLRRRLDSNEALKLMNYEHMLNYVTNGQVEPAPAQDPASTVFYLPHQAVKKEKIGKTKGRLVFDASSHETNAPSLNEALEMGPNFLPKIRAVSYNSECITNPPSAISQGFPSVGLTRRGQRLKQILVVQDHARRRRTSPHDG
jgi:hypothetical protein